jgi:hypothetical protein
MRTQEEIQKARDIVCQHMANPALSNQQKILFTGISCALQWAGGSLNMTMERLFSGEPVALGKEIPEEEVNKMYSRFHK